MLTSVAVLAALGVAFAAPPLKPNVLVIIADDLRPDLGAYGQIAVTPNIDALASRGVTFDRAYCQISVCSPSRNSFMSGLRPDQSKVWNFIDNFREYSTTALSWPEFFKVNGYTTLGLGKTYHPGSPPNYDEPNSWSGNRPYFNASGNHCPHGGEGGGLCQVPAQSIWDNTLTDNVLETMAYLAANESARPFALFVGYRSPHAPWASPISSWEQYKRDEIPIAKFPTPPTNMPNVSFIHNFALKDLTGKSYPWSAQAPVADDIAQLNRQAYYSSINFLDGEVGRIIQNLTDNGWLNDTIVSFNADHGYSLGEQGEWEKKSEFELVNRVPWIVSVPWKEDTHGQHVKTSFAELVDLYPTLAGLAGLPKPTGLDSTDLSPLFDDTSLDLKQAAFSQYPRCGAMNEGDDSCNQVPASKFVYMGYSVRTPLYRYTEWYNWNQTSLTPILDESPILELYNHTGDAGDDFDAFEHENIAAEPAVKGDIEQLRKVLWSQYGKYIPGAVPEAAE